jgi:hypothetical protein
LDVRDYFDSTEIDQIQSGMTERKKRNQRLKSRIEKFTTKIETKSPSIKPNRKISLSNIQDDDASSFIQMVRKKLSPRGVKRKEDGIHSGAVSKEDDRWKN